MSDTILEQEDQEDQEAIEDFEDKIVDVLEQTDMNKVFAGTCSDILITQGIALFISTLENELLLDQDKINEIKNAVMLDIANTYDEIASNITEERFKDNSSNGPN